MNNFYIVNEFDRPCEKLIAEMWADGKLHYVHPELRKGGRDYGGMSPDWATSLAEFGVEVKIENGFFKGEVVRDSSALYEDGGVRRWQGSTSFRFKYLGDS